MLESGQLLGDMGFGDSVIKSQGIFKLIILMMVFLDTAPYARELRDAGRRSF